VSGVVHEQVQGRLDCTFDVLGEQVLKNIARPVPVYRVAAGPPASGRQPGETPAVRSEPLPLPDKPSIAVLPFQNMSGDSEQNYFADGIVEEIITALSRMRWLFVIARNSSFTYKGQAVDVKRVGRELGVRYVLEGSVRRAGDRLRITAQLVEAETGVHLWADRFDGSMEDVFEFQEEATRRVVAAVAPGIESAEIAFARRSAASSDALSAAWRAMGLFNDAIQQGNKAAMLAAIDEAQKALSLDQGSLSALSTLGFAYRMSHLYRWGDDPNQALDQAWAVSERMMAVDALDERTLIDCGLTRVARGEHERGIADLQRAFQVNPNSAIALRALAYVEARLGMSAKAKEHALAFLRLCPRDNIWIGPAQLALAMACYTAGEYAEAVHWAELAIQSQPRAPIRRSIMIACAARAGDLAKAARERTMLNSFAPDFIPSLFRGENPVFTRPEDLEHLLEGLRLAMGPAA
jgi:TolB-like protein